MLALVVLSTLAAVIASQAVISGVFSLTRQAIQLGYLPRMEIQHTSETEIGQIYIPRVNWMLMAAIVALVVGFGSSERAGRRLRPRRDRRHAGRCRARHGGGDPGVAAGSGRSPSLVFGLLAMPDLAFFIANALKIPDGGWLPLLVAGAGVLHHHHLAARPRAGRPPTSPRARCRSPSSSSAWSARPTASPAPRCS